MTDSHLNSPLESKTMPITQISIAVENEPGRLHEICDLMEKEQINIKGIMAAAKLKPVQLHMIVDDPDRAAAILDSAGYAITTKEVLAVAAPDHPGGLNAVMRTLLDGNINVETLYPFIKLNGNEAILIMEVDDLLKAKSILKSHWIKSFGPEIYKS